MIGEREQSLPHTTGRPSFSVGDHPNSKTNYILVICSFFHQKTFYIQNHSNNMQERPPAYFQEIVLVLILKSKYFFSDNKPWELASSIQPITVCSPLVVICGNEIISHLLSLSHINDQLTLRRRNQDGFKTTLTLGCLQQHSVGIIL